MELPLQIRKTSKAVKSSSSTSSLGGQSNIYRYKVSLLNKPIQSGEIRYDNILQTTQPSLHL